MGKTRYGVIYFYKNILENNPLKFLIMEKWSEILLIDDAVEYFKIIKPPKKNLARILNVGNSKK